MLTVLRNTWALLLGMLLLMLGNGMQGTLLGIRGGYEEFSTFHMSVVMSCYFVGFLFGSRALRFFIAWTYITVIPVSYTHLTLPTNREA